MKRLFAVVGVVLFLSACKDLGRATASPSTPTPLPSNTPSTGINYAKSIIGSRDLQVSASGQFIAYDKVESGVSQVYVYDKQSGVTELISKSSSNEVSNLLAFSEKISKDGRFVLFLTPSKNLSPGITYPTTDAWPAPWLLYLRDRKENTTTLITVDETGKIAANTGITNTVFDMSDDGRYVMYTSRATNLVSGIKYNLVDGQSAENVYLRDTLAQTTELISVSSDGTTTGYSASSPPGSCYYTHSLNPAITEDGRYVAFTSCAQNLVSSVNYPKAASNVFLRDRKSKTTDLISVSSDGTSASNADCFVRPFGSGNFMSANGLSIAYSCKATNLVSGITYSSGFYPDESQANIYLRDVVQKKTLLVTTSPEKGFGADCWSDEPYISSDGNYVAFTSCATNIVHGITYYGLSDARAFTNVYRWSRISEKIELISKSTTPGEAADFDAGYIDMTPDGRSVVFYSMATNLSLDPEVPISFTTDQGNAYRWNVINPTPKLVSIDASGQALGSISPSGLQISADGSTVVFSRNGEYSGYYYTVQ